MTDALVQAQEHSVSVPVLVAGRHAAKCLVKRVLPDFFLRRTKALIAHQMPKKKDLVVLCGLTAKVSPQRLARAHLQELSQHVSSFKQLACFGRLERSEDVVLMMRKDDPCDCGKTRAGKPTL